MTTTSPAASALAQAANAAGLAPSVFNTQPWRWRIFPERLELHAERSRQLGVADPEGRLLTISCGAALHHARVALAAEGWEAVVVRLPEPQDADLLARVSLGERSGVTNEAMRRYQALQVRRTDRRQLLDQPVPPEALAEIRAAVEGEHNHLHLLHPEQVNDLSVAAARADVLEATDSALRAEMAYWVGGRRPAGTGVPDTVIPTAPQTAGVPQRDLGRTGTMPSSPGTDRSATYAVIFGAEDSPVWWLRAGEALSAAWLVASVHGVSVLPFSAPMEVSTTRMILRRLLAGVGHPYLVLRLGLVDPDEPAPPHPPRLAPTQTVELAEPGRQ